MSDQPKTRDTLVSHLAASRNLDPDSVQGLVDMLMEMPLDQLTAFCNVSIASAVAGQAVMRARFPEGWARYDAEVMQDGGDGP